MPEILETPVNAILEINPINIYQQTNNDNFIDRQELKHLYQDNKEN